MFAENIYLLNQILGHSYNVDTEHEEIHPNY